MLVAIILILALVLIALLIVALWRAGREEQAREAREQARYDYLCKLVRERNERMGHEI